MATSRLNSEEFVNLVNGLKGVILVYKSTDRDGNEKETAQQFFGADYEPKDKTQDEIFRVWKNVVMTFWAVKAEEIKLREANDGIRSKLRATTPCAVIFRTEKGETVKRFELEESVWAKIGLVPTKKDFERTARDYKKAIHAAAKVPGPSNSGGSVRGVRLRQFEDAGYEVGQVVHFHGRKVLDGGFVEGGRFRGYWRSDQGHQAVERLLLPAGGDSGRVQAESCQQGWEVRRQRSCRGFQPGNVPPGGAVSREGGDSL